MMAQDKSELFHRRWHWVRSGTQPEEESFYYGVKTTGVFCRPGCPSRLPKEENVVFFDSLRDALHAGFRPCKRCAPGAKADDNVEKVIRACRLLEETPEELSLESLAEKVGSSPWHFQRLFKRVTGLSPREYAAGLKSRRFRQLLSSDLSVTQAIYDAGFGSSSRVYERTDDLLAMSPGQFRKGGEGLRIRYALTECSLGWVLIALTGKGVCSLELGDSPEPLQTILQGRFGRAEISEVDPEAVELIRDVISLIDHPEEDRSIPLDIRGTVFQQKVWKALREIPSGETRSYAQIAGHIGQPDAARAVANACARNPIGIAVPCHRVIRSDGGLGGYRWGIARKKALLEREGALRPEEP